MRLLVLGGDGYLGWPVALRFSARGFNVCVLENFARRRWLHDAARRSLTPICPWDERRSAWESLTGRRIGFIRDDLRRPGCAADAIEAFHPDVVVHLAGQPSARWAAEDIEKAVTTFETNLFAPLRLLWAIAERAPHVHLVKLGTMGEYGRPDLDIEEGDFEIVHRGRRETMPFPQRPETLYDLSKRHDSDNALFAARAWDLRVTILRQSAVYGVNTDETDADRRLVTRFDYDAAFGAAVNRFCAQALAFGEIRVHGDADAAYPLILLADAVRCIELAVEHPPPAGSPAVCNQLGQIAALRSVAGEVARAAGAVGAPTTIVHADPLPPRPPYRAESVRLPSLGFRPTLLSAAVLRQILETLRPHRHRILAEALTTSPVAPLLAGARP